MKSLEDGWCMRKAGFKILDFVNADSCLGHRQPQNGFWASAGLETLIRTFTIFTVFNLC